MQAKLAYIVSVGHSGSTLLDMLTGSIPGCYSTGEINHLRWQLARKLLGDEEDSPQTLCSCGSAFKDCEDWQNILGSVGRQANIDLFIDPLRFKMNLLQDENYFGKRFSIDRLNRAIYMLTNKYRSLRLIANTYQKIHHEAVENNWSIFDHTARVTENTVIVDSSKSALRLSLLQNYRPDDTYILLLMRDIRGVSYSQQKRGEDPLAAAKGWVDQYNRIYTILANLNNPKIIGIKYENLAANPQATRQKIANFLGIGSIDPDFTIDTRKLHLVAGNQIRHSGVISIRPDKGWHKALNRELQSQINAIRSRLNPALDEFF